jgi:hypothetical protein
LEINKNGTFFLAISDYKKALSEYKDNNEHILFQKIIFKYFKKNKIDDDVKYYTDIFNNNCITNYNYFDSIYVEEKYMLMLRRILLKNGNLWKFFKEFCKLVIQKTDINIIKTDETDEGIDEEKKYIKKKTVFVDCVFCKLYDIVYGVYDVYVYVDKTKITECELAFNNKLLDK